MAKLINFSLPMNIYGFHSGWNDNVDPTKSFNITHRRVVYLAETEYLSYVSLCDCGESIPFYVKVKSDKEYQLTGVSSGGGCSLFKWGNKFLKIKRNGLYDIGFPNTSFLTSDIWKEGNDIYEHTIYQPAGCMLLEDVIKEVENATQLKRDGFLNAYKIVGFFILENWHPAMHKELGASIWEISSDLRADEFAFCIFTPLLRSLCEKGRLKYEPDKNMFTTNSLSITDINFGEVYDRLNHLGKVLGASYKMLHLADYIRGYSNAWYGNEIIDNNGNVSFIDLDTMLLPKDCRGINHIKRLQRIEYVQAKTNLYFLFENYDSLLFGYFGTAMIEGFEEGYNKPAYNFTKSQVNEILDEHFKSYKYIFADS